MATTLISRANMLVRIHALSINNLMLGKLFPFLRRPSRLLAASFSQLGIKHKRFLDMG
jgi:hypothetical protein